jgi:hypothetical protein
VALFGLVAWLVLVAVTATWSSLLARRYLRAYRERYGTENSITQREAIELFAKSPFEALGRRMQYDSILLQKQEDAELERLRRQANRSRYVVMACIFFGVLLPLAASSIR